jgi:hypothetical protein
MARVRSVLLYEASAAARKPALLFILLTAHAASAAVYPVKARLTLGPPASQHCLVFAGDTDCRIVRTVKEAFDTTVSRLFNPGGDAPDLQLVLSVKTADFSRVLSPRLDLVVRIRILTATGNQLDELETEGRADLLDTDKAAMIRAGQVAAGEAARDFELQYPRSRPVADWLVKSNIAAASAVAIPERGDKLISLSLGAGYVFGGGDDATALAPSARVSASYRRLMLQAMYSRYTSSFGTANGGLVTNDLGLEAGAVFRPLAPLELHLGPGVHYLFGEGQADTNVSDTNTASFSKLSLSLFASLQVSFLPFRNGARFFAGLEGRVYFFSTVGVEALGRTLPAADSSLGLVIGVELPWGSRTGSAQ